MPDLEATDAERLHTAMVSAGLAQVFEPGTALDLASQIRHNCPHKGDTILMAKQAIRRLDKWAEAEIWDDGYNTETALYGDALRDLEEKTDEDELETLGDVADWIGWWATGYHAYVASDGDPDVHGELTLPTGSLQGALDAARLVIAEEHTTEDGVAADLRSLTDDVTPGEDL